MQRVEFSNAVDMNIYCPFCGSLTHDEEGFHQPCEHVIFQAHDDGFEYLDDKTGISEDADMEDGVDRFTDTIDYPDSIKFAFYQPAPSFFGAYLGFALK